MRILVLGDSLAMPRPRQGQTLDDVWPMRLGERIPGAEVILRARNIATTFEVLQEFGWFSESLDCIDAIVLQVGIVDANPRPFPFLVQRFIAAFASRSVQRWINKHVYRLKFLPWRPWTSERQFRERIEEILRVSMRSNPRIRIALLKIAPAGGHMVQIIKGSAESVARYNAIIDEIGAAPEFRACLSIADPYSSSPLPVNEIIIEDGHHLSKKGHELARDAVASALLGGEAAAASPENSPAAKNAF